MRREKNLSARDKWELRQYREAGVSVRQCAQLLNCSEATAYRALAELREKFGAEQVHRLRRQFARPTLHRALIDHQSQPNIAEKHE